MGTQGYLLGGMWTFLAPQEELKRAPRDPLSTRSGESATEHNHPIVLELYK
jgi:hypothetical protein